MEKSTPHHFQGPPLALFAESQPRGQSASREGRLCAARTGVGQLRPPGPPARRPGRLTVALGWVQPGTRVGSLGRGSPRSLCTPRSPESTPEAQRRGPRVGGQGVPLTAGQVRSGGQDQGTGVCMHPTHLSPDTNVRVTQPSQAGRGLSGRQHSGRLPPGEPEAARMTAGSRPPGASGKAALPG